MRTQQAIQLGSIELFCKAAELGSFTAAAEALGLTPASVSRAIARMEARLGLRLFARTTRQVQLTAEGELYWQACRQALTRIQAAEQALSGQQQIPHGRLRISVGSLYANHRLLPALPAFTERYPQVELELSLSNRVADLVEEGYDAAIRIGTPPDSSLIGHPLELATLGVFATPAYLQQHGTPATPAQLAAHRCLRFVQPSSGRPTPWLFCDPDGQPFDLTPPQGPLLRDDPAGCISLGLAGGGLFQTYHFIVQAALASGQLCEVLPAYAGRSRQITLLYPDRRHASARLRAFVEFVRSLPAPSSIT